MRNPKILTFIVDSDTGLVYSRLGYDLEVAIPVLDFVNLMDSSGKFHPAVYYLEKCDVYSALATGHLIYTKKIPRLLKNIHRRFWGMRELLGNLSKWELAGYDDILYQDVRIGR